MTLVLTIIARPPHRIDASALLPERLAPLTLAEIAAVPVTLGNRRVPLGTLCEVGGTPGDTITLRGACDRLDRVGAGMTGGAIIVESDVGGEAGCGMGGGRLTVLGSAGPCAGAEMRGGVIEVAGDVGAWAGAGRPGSVHGMSGGVLLVRGSAGERLADRMKRGLVVVEGDAGAGLASRMIAGTVVVLGAVGPHVGIGMRRGMVLLRHPVRLSATFVPAGRHDLGILRLVRRELAAVSDAAGAALTDGMPVHRWIGCTGAGGRGEVLAPEG